MLQTTAGIIGVGTVAALVVGVVVGLVIGDVPRGLGTWGTVVLVAFAVYAVVAAYRAGEKGR